MPLIAYDGHAFCLQPVGGVSRYVCELADRVARLPGHATRVIAPLHYNQHLRAASGLSVLGRYWALQHPSMWRIYRAANAVITPPVLAALRPTLLHTTYYWGVPRIFRRPVVVTVHDMIHELYPSSFRPDDPTRAAKRRVVERADHVICVSHSTARDLTRLLGVPESKITVTYLGFADSLSSVPALPPATNVRPYLLYVGQRHGYKNFAAMLEAWGSSERLRRDVDVLAFGAGAFTIDEQAQIARLSPRPDAVRQQGGSDADLARAYRGARALVYPSAYEGFGIPPLEAMSVDCPVACSVASSLPEVVGDAALGFDPSDLDAMRSAMERVAGDESLRAALIERGRQRVRQFSWERCATTTAAVYRRLAG
jgi:glycosyltransferase involved in cell wall biosynthesis